MIDPLNIISFDKFTDLIHKIYNNTYKLTEDIINYTDEYFI